jgi:hypothetical protein
VIALLLIGVMLYGLPLALWASARLRGLELAGVGFLLGAGTISLHLFALSLLGVAWTRTAVLLSLAPLLVLAVPFARRALAASPVDERRTEAPVAWADLIVLVPVVAYAIFALWAPPYEWDFYGIWGLKGRFFFDARGVDWSFLRINTSHPDYPLLVPLFFDFVAVVSGGWNDAAFGWIYVAFCASLLAIVRAHSSPWVTLAVAFPALSLWIGLGEAPVTAFGCAALLMIRRGDDRLGALLLGFAAWSKNEGLALIVTAAVALLMTSWSVRRVLRLWPAAALIAPWLIARSLLHLPTDLAQGGALGRILGRFADPVATAKALATAPPDQPFLWLAVLAIVLVYIRSAVQRERFLLVALLLQGAALVIPLLATPFDLAGHAQFSLNRILHQIVPAAVFLAAILARRDLSAPSPSGGSLRWPRPSTD